MVDNPNPAALPANRLKKPTQIAFISLLLALMFGVQVVAVHTFFTSIVPGGNDFYPRWYGGKMLLTEGHNPYSDAVTHEIEAVLDPLQQRTNSFNFAFPLHVLFLMLPLVFLSYAWAQATWMVLLIWLAIGCLLLLLRMTMWPPPPAKLLGASLLLLTAYPVARTFFLGQFTIHVTLALIAALLLLREGRDGWAGAVFALASIKPQMVVLIAPWLFIWCLRQKRWRFFLGLLASGGALFAASLLLLSSWPFDFFNGLSDYAAVAGGRNALLVLVGWLPASYHWIATVLAVLLGLGLLLAVWQGWGEPAGKSNAHYYLLSPSFDQVLYWAIVVTLLVPFQTGTTNQLLLLLPLFIWGMALHKRFDSNWFVLLPVSLTVALWVLFFKTLRIAKESELMFLPLPLLVTAILVVQLVRQHFKQRNELAI